MKKRNRVLRPVYDNNIDAFIPELWSQEILATLNERMVIANLVHRDFENTVANFGDTVNTRKPGTFTAISKGANDDVTTQNATATNVAVPLNQHIHTSFLIRDSEASKSFQDLVGLYVRPAAESLARRIDQMLLGQFIHFRNNFGGNLSGMSDSNAKSFILEVREAMNIKNVDMMGRNLILTPNSETNVLKNEHFTAADKLGDNGTAIREASLGRRLGFDIYMCQNMSHIPDGNTIKSGAINNANGYAVGDTSLTVDGFTGTLTAGAWLKIAGDDTPHRVASTTATSGNATGIVLVDGLRRAVADNAVVKVYTPGAVNNGSGYDAGHYAAITVDGFSVAPKKGQSISFGTASAVYTVMGTPTTTSITLDRPLDAAIADDAAVGIIPPGSYNFAFHKNALALVVRPLGLPMEGTARGAVISDPLTGLSVRVVFTYDGVKQGHRVTADLLCGTKVLDTDLGALMYA